MAVDICNTAMLVFSGQQALFGGTSCWKGAGRTVRDVDDVQSCHRVDGERVVQVHEALVAAHVVAVLGAQHAGAQRVRGAVGPGTGVVLVQVVLVRLQLL